MREVNDNEYCIPNLCAHDVIDYSRTCNVAHVNEIVAKVLLHDRLHHIFHEGIQSGIIELHGDETVVPPKLTTLFGLVLLPSLKT